MKIRAKAKIQVGDVWEWDRGQIRIMSTTREDLDNGIEENIVGLCCKKSHRNASVGFAFNYTTEELLAAGYKLIERNGDPIKPEPETLIDRIKAQYPDYEVVECKERKQSLDLVLNVAGLPLHINAQSMKGFYTYIYEEEEGSEGDFFNWNHPTYQRDKYSQMPVAVLFSGAKS
jgi:hypothetical protein